MATIQHINPTPPKKKQHIDLKKRKKSKKRKLNIILSIAMLLVGMALIVVGNFDHVQGFFSQNLQSLVTGKANKNKQKSKPNYDFKKVKPISAASLAQAYRKRSNYKAIGQVAIPSLKINLNVYRGVGNMELNLGAGSMKPHQKMGQGNYCLAAHNMDDGKSYFSPIYSTIANKGKLVGRKVYLMNYYTVYTYKLDKAYYISATRVDLLNNVKHQKTISLFTCDYTGAGRVFTQGRLIKKQALNRSPKAVRQAFKIN